MKKFDVYAYTMCEKMMNMVFDDSLDAVEKISELQVLSEDFNKVKSEMRKIAYHNKDLVNAKSIDTAVDYFEYVKKLALDVIKDDIEEYI